jgi:hypothetical protein
MSPLLSIWSHQATAHSGYFRRAWIDAPWITYLVPKQADRKTGGS